MSAPSPNVRVGDLAEQVRGVSYGKEDASTVPLPGYVPVLRAGNITDNGLVFGDLVYVPAERVASKQRIRRHDVVVAASSGSLDVVGKAAPALADFDGGFGAFCKVLRPNSKVHPGYFAQYFKTQRYRRRVSALAAGANINNLRNEHLDDMEIPLPPLAEQRRIADVLDRAEALRAKRRAALAQLDTLTEAIFLDFFGDPETNPKGWPLQRLQDTLSMPLRNGLSPSNTGKVMASVLTLSAITGGEFDASAWKTSPFKSAPPPGQAVNEADFLICRGNGNVRLVGKGYFPTGPMPGLTFPDTMIAARVSPERIDGAFMQYVWNSSAVRLQIESLARTTNGTFKVNQTMLETIAFVAPPLELQHEFARRVGAVERLRAIHRASLAELDALFGTLQHRAFRGEL